MSRQALIEQCRLLFTRQPDARTLAACWNVIGDELRWHRLGHEKFVALVHEELNRR